MHKHMFRLRAIDSRGPEKIYYFECESCWQEHSVIKSFLWPKPVRVLDNLKLEYISIDSVGMGRIISVTPQMAADVQVATQRDLLMKRRGW